MSAPNASPGGAAPKNNAAPILVIAVVVVAVVGLALFGGSRSGVRLDRSPPGFEGLALWLKAQGRDARMFRGGDALTEDRVGLRVLPLHDADLTVTAERPRTTEERLLAETERDVDAYVVQRKRELLPTLVILPKWRAGVRGLELAHPDLLVGERTVARVARQTIGADQSAGLQVVRPRAADQDGWVQAGWTGLKPFRLAPSEDPALRLYHPQLVVGSGCRPLVELDGAMLLGRCRGRDRDFFLLTDPDLMNNHGLSQGDNAALSTAVIELFAEDGPVLVDVTSRLWGSTFRSAPPRERSWSDLSRFLEPPFTIIWIAFGLLAALALWRAWVRDRAPEPPEDDGVAASRIAAIDAKARLLRLSGHDAQLTRAHVADRIQALAAETLGPHRAAGTAGVAQLRGALSRRDPRLALHLDDFGRTDQPPNGAPTFELLAHLDRFDRFADDVRQAFSQPLRGGTQNGAEPPTPAAPSPSGAPRVAAGASRPAA